MVYRLLIVILSLSISGCTTLPRNEIDAYRQTFVAFHSVSNKILDMVAPYERATFRNSPYTQSDCRGETGVVLSAGDPFCYGVRDAFTTIGDPPLVKSYRNLIDVILRFNIIIVAYSDGVSFQLLKQEVGNLSAVVSSIDASAGSGLSGVFNTASPFAQQAADLRDRNELLSFLVQNYNLVDQAFAELSLYSGQLYAKVSRGTRTLTSQNPTLRATLNPRRKELRAIIANWTVLIDETREMLKGMNFALSNPDSLEVRLRNLNAEAFELYSGFAIVEDQIAKIGSNDGL